LPAEIHGILSLYVTASLRFVSLWVVFECVTAAQVRNGRMRRQWRPAGTSGHALTKRPVKTHFDHGAMLG
jgi:hypothetical protein